METYLIILTITLFIAILGCIVLFIDELKNGNNL